MAVSGYSAICEAPAHSRTHTRSGKQPCQYRAGITGLARQRYQLHEEMRQTIRNEFGEGKAISSRVDLYRWWAIEDEKALSDQIKQQLGAEIPLKKRGEWRGFLADQKSEHCRLTDQIIALETRLNSIVYDAFDLTAEERQLIEATTKYPYGEV